MIERNHISIRSYIHILNHPLPLTHMPQGLILPNQCSVIVAECSSPRGRARMEDIRQTLYPQWIVLPQVHT